MTTIAILFGLVVFSVIYRIFWHAYIHALAYWGVLLLLNMMVTTQVLMVTVNQ